MIVKDCISYRQTVPEILKEINLINYINTKQLLIKPNLTIDKPHPVTTSVLMVEAVVNYLIEANYSGRIIVADGAGGRDTNQVFDSLGYRFLVNKYGVELRDLNREPRVEMENSGALVLKKVILPKIVLDSYVINLPVLKDHHEAILTAAMKNIFGLYLNQSFLAKRGDDWLPKEKLLAGQQDGWWNKGDLHDFGVAESIYDLNRYAPFDFNLVDASIGQRGGEINGQPVDPPIGKMLAGFEARELDLECAKLMGLNVTTIKYLNFS